MDPNERKYEIVTARRFDMTREEWAHEAKAINEADERDGTVDRRGSLGAEESGLVAWFNSDSPPP